MSRSWPPTAQAILRSCPDDLRGVDNRVSAVVSRYGTQMVLGHVLGGGSSINALTWTRGYDGWERSEASGWSFKDVLPIFRAQEDWEGGANQLRDAGGPVPIRRSGHSHPRAVAFLDAARKMGFPILDDMNGPCGKAPAT